jgi:hypothetical protein
MAPHASWLVQLGIPGLAVLVVGLLAWAVRRALGARVAVRFGAAALGWLVLTGLLGMSGFLADFESRPPRLALVLLPTLALPVLLGSSRWGGALAALPVPWLIGFQAFRLPLELVMHRAALDGTMPPQMTYTGHNFDIVTGTSAVVVALLAARGSAPRWLLFGWNLLGTVLLLTIVAIAVLSLPMFALYGRGALNTWVAYFPYVWLPSALVSSAILGHLLLWRRLLAKVD